MTFAKMLKTLGVRALYKECCENLFLVNQYINILFKKSKDFDTSRYMQEIKEYLRIDLENSILDYKSNVLEVIEKINYEG